MVDSTPLISCWLVPPEPNRTDLQALVRELAQRHGLQPFEPHVTLIGNLGLSEADAVEKLKSLAGTGSVPVQLTAVEAYPVWNQSLMAVAADTPELCSAHALARQAFWGTTEQTAPLWAACVATARTWC